MTKQITIQGVTYLTGGGIRARWQRLRLWRAYRRPVTYNDLRRIAHGLCYRDGDYRQPDPVGAALFDSVVREAELPVFGREGAA
ncbi:hypothetical protein [Tropicimonas isoalkanivorans]|uniref:Uncharacterized protein n=1 Tax=Tropicimonas isoalkanivorans TaxID=441112 RepID=A0A1I1LX07_9RHOB|nr:hypothetical protein [Tropicimonas isoalkanivorans]SFC77631.1 hypothetical protein SAMN04488094_10957 [Tropicimonas isoalkanivorans]